MKKKYTIILGLIALIIVAALVYFNLKGAKYVTLTQAFTNYNQIEFVKIDVSPYKSKSKLQKLQLEALQELPPKSSIKLKIESPNGVYFANKTKETVKVLETEIAADDSLPVIEYELISTWELDNLIMTHINIEVYFGTDDEPVNYNYATNFLSTVITQ
ncbi:hypothetical protein [Allomuricauda sp. SCSIO 65647]|uniref:hypothetical protein n=1 Tax=Allomuricauda sp. SCSIO 65647 TaxID=2908843 RepID=UPI001F4151C8|nr:hypothetical protein [Muricauda sp. SCSIO 65647]UJH67361.1 hypothetical protein L0P89_15600 [Muricauda sp. SCSIO 65647]